MSLVEHNHVFQCVSGKPDVLVVVPAIVSKDGKRAVGFKIESGTGLDINSTNMIMHMNDVRVLRDLLNRILE